MITTVEMAILDENTDALGVSQKQLMESSGNAVAQAVREHTDPESTVAIVCGRGNNGGDGFVAARFLAGYDVTVHLIGRPTNIRTEIARENWEALQSAAIEARSVSDSSRIELGNPDIVVDGLLGTGVTGALREPEATAAEAINAADTRVVAIDVPSGVDADTGEAVGTAVSADDIVTFHDMKPGLAEMDTRVTIADIGIPHAAELFVDRGDLLRLSRDPHGHKGDFGTVLVVGGGPYTGAPALTAQASLRAGADLAFVACPASVADEIQGYSENLIVDPLPDDRITPDHVPRLLERARDVDTVVVGPGMGDHHETVTAIEEFLTAVQGTVVVDADALSVVPTVETAASLICTPHQGEFAAMGGEIASEWRDRAQQVESFAGDLGQILVVKCRYDVISDGETTRVNRTGNPGMTVGGTGDVLAGVTGALACVAAPVDGAAIAAYANGTAGDIVIDEYAYGLVATDLLEALPDALWPNTAADHQ